MKQLVILFTLLALSLVQPANAMYSDSIYSTYNQIENAVLSDPKLVFKLREVFHPVTTERRWQVDGVQVIPILLCINFNPAREADICGTNKTLSPNTEYCKWFQWTNSYLLNLISPELLLTMDPVVYSVIYSEIVRSVHSPFNLVQLTDIEVNLSCVPSFDDFLSASALFLSWSKLYAIENSGKPTRWDTKYQGYIAKWYTYFEADPQFRGLTKHHQILYTQLGLWINFVLLNILIPVAFIKRGGWIYQHVSMSRSKYVLRRIFPAMPIITAIYFGVMTSSHIKYQLQSYPIICHNIIGNYSDTEMLPVIFCHGILGMLITKVIILPAAILTELITAIVYAMKMRSLRSTSCCTTIGKVLALWQLFVFVQLTLGLITIPLLIMILISPAQSILLAGVTCTPFLLFASLLILTPCTKSCKYTLKLHWSTLLENTVAACLITAAFLTYYSVVSYGASMNSIKGYILSLIPTVPISIFVWTLKRKFTNKNTKHNIKTRERKMKNMLQERRRASLSTEEEMIFMSDTSADDASD